MTTNTVVDSLNKVLVQTYALLALTQMAHWNVEGPGFFQLHKAFEDQYNDLFGAVDSIAERIRALGEYAMTKRAELLSAFEAVQIPAQSTGFVPTVWSQNEIIATTIHEAIKLVTEQGDLVTQNLLIERLAAHEKAIWMLNASSIVK